ncbi:MAG: siphovirus Gp157 family protein, partial [Terrisporobacter sp.]|uniref:siphovirus Gp157 family protein n=1 Tax=Terrisporobacter sp. TaxID=1965305 RepID=UPI002A90DD28
MNTMKIYELTRNYQNLEVLLDNESVDNAVLKEEMDKIVDTIEVKFTNIQKIITNYKAIAEKQKEDEDRIRKERQANEKKIEVLREYMLTNLEKLENKKLKTDSYTFSTKKVESVIVDLDLLTEEYYKITKTADKTKIKQDIKSGKEV